MKTQAGRRGYYVTGTRWRSCSPSSGPGSRRFRTDTGFGPENYDRLFTCANGVRLEHVLNSVVVSALTVAARSPGSCWPLCDRVWSPWACSCS